MDNGIRHILGKKTFTKADIVELLMCEGENKKALFAKSAEITEKYIGRKVWLRGLIEFSNICGKNCLYCGIRKGNHNIERYSLSDEEIVQAATFALRNSYGSIALQSGELESCNVTDRIEKLVRNIKNLSAGKLGITLSVGEQTPETYKRWFEAGAHRYLLRMEATNELLYAKIHPNDAAHSFHRRLDCLKSLQDTGYQTGTGVMIGLPFQTADNLADDLLFMNGFDIDMCGMGPYIEHADTPLANTSGGLLSIEQRFELTLKMIAIIRIMMKDINIVASTAMQAIYPAGRERAISAGANIIMPNITPLMYRGSYRLYDNKPITDVRPENSAATALAGAEVAYGSWGDSSHYGKRTGIRQ
ncbi:MAG: [FeFe] hydrogenase H-cluster radical SAM maturase HydE [Bacteroidales bacterium]|jgi:biotin synthase|nr:[FeFe] hydrogenase H-cluster radical SAM maturase HydE [Bacteroidales bacterium]